jgi:exodeoxyribonuclease V alpha subunit
MTSMPQTLPDSLPFTALDRAFAAFLARREPSPDPRHLWLAALASHQYGRGHACLDLAALSAAPGELLAWNPDAIQLLPTDLVRSANALPWTRGGPTSPLVLEATATAGRLYLRRAWQDEQTILERLAERQALPVEPPARLSERLDALFGDVHQPGIARQRQACEVAAHHRFTLVTGGPGTGKTTTVVRLLALLAAAARDRGKPFVARLAAPTGKAASRLSQSIGGQLARLPAGYADGVPTEATTLHKLLGLTGDDADQPSTPIVADAVVVDEASMIDLGLMARLLAAVPVSARLILLGDKDQLASVEAGAVLAQLCTRPSLAAQTVTLTYSHRFGADSAIGQWAARVNAGEADAVVADLRALPRWSSAGADPIRRLVGEGREPLAALIRQGWADWLARLQVLTEAGTDCDDRSAEALLDAFADYQILCALREGPEGVAALNARAETALGFDGRVGWYVGRPVMVTRNDYALKLMNGDIGLTLPRDGGRRVAFRDADGRLRWVLPSRLQDVETVFAMTVHKSQGSEWPDLLLVLPGKSAPVLTRELLYTGLTRSMQRLTLLAPSTPVLREAVQRRVTRSGGLAGDWMATPSR